MLYLLFLPNMVTNMNDNYKLSYMTAIKELLPYLWSHSHKIHKRLILYAILVLSVISVDTSIPFILKFIISFLSAPAKKPYELILLLMATYGGAWGLSQVLRRLREVLFVPPLENAARHLKMKVFDHLHHLSLRFHIERGAGNITTIIGQLSHGFDNLFWGLIAFMLPNLAEIVIAMGILGYKYGIFYSVVLFFILLTYVTISMIGMRWATYTQKVYNEKARKADTRIIDSLLNVETVKYFNNIGHEDDYCNNLLREKEKAAVNRFNSLIYFNIVQMAVIGLGIAIMSWFSGKAVLAGIITTGDFVLINTYVMQFTGPLHHFSYVLEQARKGLVDTEKAIEILHIKPEVLEVPNAKTLIVDHKATVTFDNVTFSYNPDRTILKNVSFTIPEGKTMAIVGTSGSGKSTIVRLLFRFYNIDSGAILINNQDISKVTLNSLADAIGIVPQETVLFNSSLFYNIKYSKLDATKKQVEDAIKAAHLTSFIKQLPKGYDTVVGEKGLKLSGGEKQRVGIARVFLKNPAIYIFDEATSALDTATEQEIQCNLKEISSGSTTLIIAHRLSTIVHADEIIVLDKGEIVERGTHNSLLKHKGIYKKLWQQQSKKGSCDIK